MSDEILCHDCLDTGWIHDREGRTVCSCIAETEPYQQLIAEVEALRESGIGAAAALAAAISLLERGGRKAAPSDKMFYLMLDDYRKALENARAALRGEGEK